MQHSSTKQYNDLKQFIHGEISGSYREIYAMAYEDLDRNPRGEAQFFWNFLRSLNLKVDQRFFEDFQYNDGFQILDQMGRLTYFSLNIAKLLKFDIEHVLSTPFDQLFERDPFVTKRVFECFTKIMTSPKREVCDLDDIPLHVVKQVGFPDHSYTVAFKRAYPVYTSDNVFYGFVLRLDVKPVQN